MASQAQSAPNRRAVVTGAAGFIGSRVAQELHRRGYDVQGIDRTPGPGITQADLTEPGPWEELLGGATVVVHAAARVSDRGTAKEFRHDNVEATRTVLQACAKAKVGRVVHLSATAVHGKDKVDDSRREVFFMTAASRGVGLERVEKGLTEAAAPQPTGTPAIDTKIEAEQIATDYARQGLPVVVARLSEVYGPGSLHWTIRPVELISHGLGWVPPGGGGMLCPLYIDDAVEGIVTLAEHPQAAGEVFQLCGSEIVSAYDFFAAYADPMGMRIHRMLPGGVHRVTKVGRAVRPIARSLGFELPATAATFEYLTHPSAYSNHKAYDVIGWRPRTSLNAGIPRTLEWLQEQGYPVATASR